MSHRKSIQIQKAGEHSYWDFEVYTEKDYSDTLTGFVKQHDDGDVEFVVESNQAMYHKKSMDEMVKFVQNGTW